MNTFKPLLIIATVVLLGVTGVAFASFESAQRTGHTEARRPSFQHATCQQAYYPQADSIKRLLGKRKRAFFV